MGSVVLSVDAELGWGFHDYESPPADRLENARSGWRTLLGLCDTYSIPATWAVVAHLMLSDCDGRHEDHPAADDWFDHERGPDKFPDELRFGDGLVDAIETADVDHDIGCHTFSHVEFGAYETGPRLAREELRICAEIARERGYDFDSFVFPRNKIGHRDGLADYDFEVYRGPRPGKHEKSGIVRAAGKMARAAIVSESPPLVRPRVDRYGVINVPGSLFLFGFEGLARSLVEPVFGDPIVRQARLGIDAATKRDGVFHIWLHPNDIGSERDKQRLDSIFSYLDSRRADSSLTVETMADVAKRTRAEEQWAEMKTE